MWKALATCALAGILTLTYFNIMSSDAQPLLITSHSGYLSRAQREPNPHAWYPNRPDLAFVALRNAPVEHEGFSLAIFTDRKAVDAAGRLYTLTQQDFDGILKLSRKVSALPQTGDFRNQWRISHDRTGYPIDRTLVARKTLSDQQAEDYNDEFCETSVYGFDSANRQLQTPVDRYSTLPDELAELMDLVVEAREQGERDETIVDRVKALVRNAL